MNKTIRKKNKVKRESEKTNLIGFVVRSQFHKFLALVFQRLFNQFFTLFRHCLHLINLLNQEKIKKKQVK